jgi:hypothetical protein
VSEKSIFGPHFPKSSSDFRYALGLLYNGLTI